MDQKHELSPELLKYISPESRREREEARRRDDEILESAERHLAEAKRLREALER